METKASEKSTPIISWIGFGIALFILVFTWVFHFMLFMESLPDDKRILEAFLYLSLVIGGTLLLCSLIFSLIGLFMSVRHCRRKIVPICGIIFCVLAVVPLMIDWFMQKEPATVITPPSVTSDVYDSYQDVVITVYPDGKLVCVDKQSDETPQILYITENDFCELESWLKNLDNMRCEKLQKADSLYISIKPVEDTKYDDIIIVIDAMNELNIRRFKLIS